MTDPAVAKRRIAFVLVEGFALMSFAAVTEPLRAANLLAAERYTRSSISPPGPGRRTC